MFKPFLLSSILIALSISSGEAHATTSDMVDIRSDKLRLWPSRDTAFFEGNVVAKHSDTTMKAGQMMVFYTPKKSEKSPAIKTEADTNLPSQQIKLIEVKSKVTLDIPGKNATAKYGIYDVKSGMITLSEEVVLKQDGLVLNGSSFVYDVNTKKSTLTNDKTEPKEEAKKFLEEVKVDRAEKRKAKREKEIKKKAAKVPVKSKVIVNQDGDLVRVGGEPTVAPKVVKKIEKPVEPKKELVENTPIPQAKPQALEKVNKSEKNTHIPEAKPLIQSPKVKKPAIPASMRPINKSKSLKNIEKKEVSPVVKTVPAGANKPWKNVPVPAPFQIGIDEPVAKVREVQEIEKVVKKAPEAPKEKPSIRENTDTNETVEEKSEPKSSTNPLKRLKGAVGRIIDKVKPDEE